MISSTREVYETPRPLFAELDREFGFTMDVCAVEWEKRPSSVARTSDTDSTRGRGPSRGRRPRPTSVPVPGARAGSRFGFFLPPAGMVSS